MNWNPLDPLITHGASQRAPRPFTPDPEALRRARTYLARGWGQRHYDWHGKFCIVGAVGEAVEHDALIPTLQVLGFADEIAATVWNDAKGRTQVQVLARIDEGIGRLSP